MSDKDLIKPEPTITAKSGMVANITHQAREERAAIVAYIGAARPANSNMDSYTLASLVAAIEAGMHHR